jgi:hypothetical protein
MPKVYFGRKDEPGFDLELSDDLIAVRNPQRALDHPVGWTCTLARVGAAR